MVDSLLSKATDPSQYDGLRWHNNVNGFNTPHSSFHFYYLRMFCQSWIGASVLDIGSGTGWLADAVLANGAREVHAIEPAAKNVAVAREQYPKVTVYEGTLDSFEPSSQYDLALAVMVLCHIYDLQGAFDKIGRMLKPGSELHMVVPDYDYYRTERHGYNIQIEPINKDECAVLSNREHGQLCDIVRKLDIYLAIAANSGLDHVETVPMPPTLDLIARDPRYAPFSNHPINHLMRLVRNGRKAI